MFNKIIAATLITSLTNGAVCSPNPNTTLFRKTVGSSCLCVVSAGNIADMTETNVCACNSGYGMDRNDFICKPTSA